LKSLYHISEACHYKDIEILNQYLQMKENEQEEEDDQMDQENRENSSSSVLNLNWQSGEMRGMLG